MSDTHKPYLPCHHRQAAREAIGPALACMIFTRQSGRSDLGVLNFGTFIVVAKGRH